MKILAHKIIKIRFYFDCLVNVIKQFVKNLITNNFLLNLPSTVFAAVTVDGKVHVFDLHIDKYHPIW